MLNVDCYAFTVIQTVLFVVIKIKKNEISQKFGANKSRYYLLVYLGKYALNGKGYQIRD